MTYSLKLEIENFEKCPALDNSLILPLVINFVLILLNLIDI